MKVMMVLLLALALPFTNGFTTKKKERRPIFQYPVFQKDTSLELQSSPEEQTPQPSNHNSGNNKFAFAPGATPVQHVAHYYEQDDELDVSYSVALVSCMLSLALGFGLGYGT
jgi:hypothetical protein